MLEKLIANQCVGVCWNADDINGSYKNACNSILVLGEGPDFPIRDNRFRVQGAGIGFAGVASATCEDSQIGKMRQNLRYFILISESPSDLAKAVLKGKSKPKGRFGLVISKQNPALKSGGSLYFFSIDNVLHCYDNNGQQIDASQFTVISSKPKKQAAPQKKAAAKEEKKEEPEAS
jgi:hypothetical protein